MRQDLCFDNEDASPPRSIRTPDIPLLYDIEDFFLRLHDRLLYHFPAGQRKLNRYSAPMGKLRHLYPGAMPSFILRVLYQFHVFPF